MEPPNFTSAQGQNDDGAELSKQQSFNHVLSFPGLPNRSDGPWNMLEAHFRNTSTNLPLSFRGYRNPALLSDSGTSLPDDSGYGSRPAPSIGDISGFGEEPGRDATNQDGQHQMNTLVLDEFRLPNDTVSIESQYTANYYARPPPSVATAPAEGGRANTCDECRRVFRTKSELRKHWLKHSLPFQCPLPGCNRLKGFTSQNDLDRHKRTVHRDQTLSGRWFVCHHDKCANKTPPKLWPRSDNFRSHLLRVHSIKLSADGDLQKYVYSPSSRQDLEGVGGSALSYASNIDQYSQSNVLMAMPSSHEPQLYLTGLHGMTPHSKTSTGHLHPNSTSTAQDWNSSSLPPVQEGEESFVQPFDLIETNHNHSPLGVPLGDNFLNASTWLTDAEDRDTSSTPRSPKFPKEPDILDKDPIQNGEPLLETLAVDVGDLASSDAQEHDVDADDDAETSFQDSSVDIKLPQFDGSNEEGIERYLKTLPKSLLERVLKSESGDLKPGSTETDDLGSKKQANTYCCPTCSKTFNRQCDLKKHRKRHDKPYGCTFPPCSRTFGSKNDWKRHESFQHLKVETWQCDEHKKSSTDACNKAFNRCESFKNHLSRDHEIKDPEDVKKKLERCRKASAYSPYFWCGFCLENIDVPEQSAWLLTRCNHIDDHFCGRNGHGKKNSVEWIHEDAMADVFVGRQSRLNSDPSKHTNATASKSKSIVTTEKQTPKQAHTSGPILWLCHNCNFTNNIKMSPCCMECQHYLCSCCCYLE